MIGNRAYTKRTGNTHFGPKRKSYSKGLSNPHRFSQVPHIGTRLFLFTWRNSPYRAWTSSFSMLHDHTQTCHAR
jgi:hypothetical protein